MDESASVTSLSSCSFRVDTVEVGTETTPDSAAGTASTALGQDCVTVPWVLSETGELEVSGQSKKVSHKRFRNGSNYIGQY